MAKHESPSQRLHRRRDLARVLALLWTSVSAAVTALFLFMAVSIWTGIDPDRDYEAASGGVIIAILAGLLTIVGLVRLRQLRKDGAALPPGAEPDKRPGLPGPESAARQPMRRLAEAEATLAELLGQASDSQDTSPVPPGWVDHARQTAAEAATELRAVGAKLQAVERAVDHAPAAQRERLDDGVRRLREQLDIGLDGYGGLVAAAGGVVIEAASTPSRDELTEATDLLAGLAQAMRELSR